MWFNRYTARHIIVALDFDGTIADSTHARIAATYALSGKRVGPDQVTKHTTPLDSHTYTRMTTLAGTQEYMEQHYQLLPYCNQVLHALHKERFRFAIITSRPDEIYEPVKRFIDKYRLPIKYVHNTSHSPKAYITRKLKARIILDDSLDKLIEMKDAPIHLAYLGQKSHDPNITPVPHWKAFYEYCLQIKQLHEQVCKKNNWPNNIYHQKQIIDHIYGHINH
ncbi:MAG: hypothetical protein ACQESG_08410, partial [Nanobdellota archaeon]